MESPLVLHIERLRTNSVTVDLDLDPVALELSDPEFDFIAPVTGTVTFTLVGQEVLAHGELRVAVATPCVRCLAQTRVDLRAPVDELWVHEDAAGETGPEAEREPGNLTYKGDILDATEPFRELLMSELPDRTYCREDCAGLCPGCGANLNNERCQCPGSDHAGDPLTAGEPQSEWKRTLRNLKLSDQ